MVKKRCQSLVKGSNISTLSLIYVVTCIQLCGRRMKCRSSEFDVQSKRHAMLTPGLQRWSRDCPLHILVQISWSMHGNAIQIDFYHSRTFSQLSKMRDWRSTFFTAFLIGFTHLQGRFEWEIVVYCIDNNWFLVCPEIICQKDRHNFRWNSNDFINSHSKLVKTPWVCDSQHTWIWPTDRRIVTRQCLRRM